MNFIIFGRGSLPELALERSTTPNRRATVSQTLMELEGPKQQVVARDGLVVRERYDVSSAKIGELPAGTKCTVYDVIETPGDITRARIVANSGPLAGTEGWVTTVFTSGEKGLSDPPSGAVAFANSLPREKLEAARVAFDVFDVDGSGSLSMDELRMILARPTSDGTQALSDSEIDNIVATFDVDGNGELDFEEFAVMWSAMPSDQPERGTQSRAPKKLDRQETSMTLSLSQHLSTSFAKRAKHARGLFSFKRKAIASLGVGKDSKGSSVSVLGLVEATVTRTRGKGGKKGGGAERSLTPPTTKGGLSAMDLAAMSRAMTRKLEICKLHSGDGRSLGTALGAILDERNVKVDQLVREWDVMSSGEISRVEFRKALRDPKLGIPPEFAHVDQIDALFDSLDEDHGGTLDVHEMKAALRMLRNMSRERQNEQEYASRMVETCQTRLNEIDAALATQRELERLSSELLDFRVLVGKEGRPGGGVVQELLQVEAGRPAQGAALRGHVPLTPPDPPLTPSDPPDPPDPP